MAVLAVFGAGGNVASHVTHALLSGVTGAAAEPKTVIRLVTRDPEALRGSLGTPADALVVQIVKGSVVDTDSLPMALEGVERAFFVMPQTLASSDMVQVSNRFTDAAKAAGVKVIVRLSSLGIDGRGEIPSDSSQGDLGSSHVEGEGYTIASGLALTSIRPTSFSTNFVKYDLENVRNNSKFCSPLGHSAAVNWVTCQDIGAVAAQALTHSKWDGQVLDVTGPPTSTLTAGAMASILSSHTGREIVYEEVEPPPVADMQGLWKFLRNGGFDCSTDTVKRVTGRAATDFADFLKTLDLAK